MDDFFNAVKESDRIKSRLTRIKLRNGKETWCGIDDLQKYLGMESTADYFNLMHILHPRYSPEKIYVKLITALSKK